MKFPYSANNWMSAIGSIVALVSFSMFLFLLAITIFLDQGSSYLGLFIYIVLPIFLIIGLTLIPIGMIIKIRKEKKEKTKDRMRWLEVNLNNPRHRNAFFIFSACTAIFLFFTSIGSYEAFHFTESTEFCGKLCHNVMEPEFVAYQNSPHARIKCAECHIGSGADWYVKSKLSGLYQLYAVLSNSFPRPIPTPIADLRPAKETCEKCHWPEKFYSRQLITEKHFLADEQNTEWDINLQMKIGPNYSAMGLAEGIHWHINSDIKIEYIAGSDDREQIPWIKYTNLKTNKSIIYTDDEFPLDQTTIESSEIRIMDCMDCHNRPSHKYYTPTHYIDNLMTSGKLPRDIPNLKLIAMEVLNVEYESKDSAMFKISKGIKEYYESGYPEIVKKNPELLNNIVSTIQAEFNKNAFPEMKVNWKAYPDHISHVETNGCFRCHDNKHKSENDEIIRKDCNLCHSIVAQGNPDSLQFSNFNESLEFKHPVDIDESWKEFLCSECHNDLF